MKWTLTIPAAPSRECSPNWSARPDARGRYPSHRRQQAMKAAGHTQDRTVAFSAAVSERNASGTGQPWRTLQRLPHDQPLLTTWVVHWECGRKLLDPDNAHASLKWMQDGVAKALGRDDKYWDRGRVSQVVMEERCLDGTGGYVELTIEEVES